MMFNHKQPSFLTLSSSFFVFLLLCLAKANVILAQKQGNQWYFGKYAGVSFNGTGPTALLNGKITFPAGHGHNEGTSAISDSLGNLLFYSDGMTVWNKNHQVMLNGSGLLGNFSSTQSSIIVPDPLMPNRYFYLFTISSGFCCGGNIADGMRYSRIDLCLDSAKGGVMVAQKNIKLVDSVAEKIAVCRHANGLDYWILTHRFYSNEFWALRLTSAGITDTVISAIGSIHSGNISGSQGQMKFSPNGSRVALGASNGLDLLEVFDFNTTSGVVSNALALNKPNNNQASVYGVEFSPDNTKLYASGTSSMGLMYAFLAQYDLSAGGGNLADINASMFEVYHNNTGTIGGKGLQLAPDNKIYWVSLSINNPSGTLAVVHNPNIQGSSCNYQDQAISLGGKQGSYSLPSFIAGYSYSNGLTQCENPLPLSSGAVEASSGISLYPNPCTKYLTMDGLPNGQEISLQVYNSFGQKMKSIRSISGHRLTIGCDDLAPGVYQLQLVQDGKMIYRSAFTVLR